MRVSTISCEIVEYGNNESERVASSTCRRGINKVQPSIISKSVDEVEYQQGTLSPIFNESVEEGRIIDHLGSKLNHNYHLKNVLCLQLMM